jgi:hypothetical protein
MKKITLAHFVERGLFQEAIELAQKNNIEKKNENEQSWLIGALSFKGQLELVEKELKACPFKEPQARARAIFFTLLLNTRLSHYSRAKELLFELEEHKNFYHYQAFGFFYFYQGRFQEAWNYACLSYEKAQTNYEKLLATDLRAHAEIQRGFLTEGLALLEEARELALTFSLTGQAHVIQASALAAKLEFGLDLIETREQVDELIGQSLTQDFYTLSGLLIDRARAAILEGKLSLAEELAQKASLTLYRSQNKRQIILLNLLLARIAALKTDFLRAFSLVETSLKLCDPEVDGIYQMRVMGMKLDLMEDLKDHPWAINLGIFRQGQDQESLLKELTQLTFSSQRLISLRQLARQNRLESSEIIMPERTLDPMGDLMNRVSQLNQTYDEQQERNLVEIFLEQKLFGLLSKLPSFKGHAKLIALDWPYGQLLSFEHADVHSPQEKPPLMLRKLLSLLVQGAMNKQALIEKLYNYNYDPLIHDPLIYALMTRLRKTLGPHAHFVLLTEEGYALAPEVKVHHALFSAQLQPVEIDEGEASSKDHFLMTDLNYRQVAVLELLKKEVITSISPGDYRQRFDISRITATRDLKTLCDSGQLITLGRARGIHYRLPSP